MNQTVLTRQRFELPSVAPERRGEWQDMVKTACYTVSLHSPRLITATTVSASAEGLSAVQRHELLSLAQDIAASQKLCAEVEDDGTHLVARFSRPATVRVITPDAAVVSAQAPREEGAGTPQLAGSFLNHFRRFANHNRASDDA